LAGAGHGADALRVTRPDGRRIHGSLIWPVNDDKGYRNGVAPFGFLRLLLDDETLGVTPPPPCHPRLNHDTCALSEHRGKLCCLVRPVPVAPDPDRVLEMWMTDDVVRAQWEWLYAKRDVVRSLSQTYRHYGKRSLRRE
jgi:hypothetical protein